VLAANKIKLISAGRSSVNARTQPLVEALEITNFSATSAVLLCFLSLITLGLYLLWTRSLVRCICNDKGNFFCRALQTTEKLSEEVSDVAAMTIGKGTIKEGIIEEELFPPPLVLPGDNILKRYCEALFENFSGSVLWLGKYKISGNSAYELFRNLMLEGIASKVGAPYGSLVGAAISQYSGESIELNKRIGFFLESCLISAGPGGFPKMKNYAWDGLWMNFLNALRKLLSLSTANWEYRSMLDSKRLHISTALRANFDRPNFTDSCSEIVAEKVRVEFQSALAASVGKPPLRKFFALTQSEQRKGIFPSRIQRAIGEGLCAMKCATKFFTFPPSFTCATSAEIAWLLPLDGTGEDYDGAEGMEKNAVAAEINRVLRTVGDALRRELATAIFEFALTDGSDGLPEQVAQITFPQFCCAKIMEWKKTISIYGVANDALIRHSKECADAAQREFYGSPSLLEA
jgi:hypothetical protein